VRRLKAFDLVIFAYIAILTAVVLVARPPRWPVYLAYHAAVTVLSLLAIEAYPRFGGRLWRFVRYWYPLVVVLSAFREIHYLVPDLHPFEDGRYDRLLAQWDRRAFGDVEAFCLAFPRPLIDLLHIGYWSYFALLVGTATWIYRTRNDRKADQVTTVIIGCLLTSYLGYPLLPAVGPHWFHTERPPVLDGWLIGGLMYRTLLEIEWKMPDAFPSGHALMAFVVVGLAWRLDRRLFRWILLPAVACVVSTVVLRYHYVVDVLAAVLLFPPCYWGFLALDAGWHARGLASRLPQ
jgi:membrane-associated phospholipid phosphatase